MTIDFHLDPQVPRSHSSDSLHMVTKATTQSRLLYAALARYGYTLATDRARIERLLSRLVRMDYLAKGCANFFDLLYKSELALLDAVVFDSYNVLQCIFPLSSLDVLAFASATVPL